MIQVFIGGKLVLPEYMIETSFLMIQNGELLSFGVLDNFLPPEDGEMVDMSGCLLIANTPLKIGYLIKLAKTEVLHQYRITQGG